MAGRKPIPTRLKVLTGARIRGRSHNEPQTAGLPKCPSHLDAIARTEWRRIVPLLVEMGVIGRADMAVLAGYCSNYSIMVKAQLALDASGGLVSPNRLGTPTPDPHIAILRQAASEMRKFASELGLSPASRTRLSGTNAAATEENVFEQLAREIQC